MLAIKLQRIGKKHQPSYRLVVAEKRSKMASPPVEDLGFYNSFSKQFEVKQDRIAHWLKVGALPTVTVHNLLVKKGVHTAKPLAVKMNKPEVVPASAEAAPVVAEAPQAAPVAVEAAGAPEEAVQVEAPASEAPTEEAAS